MHSPLMAARKPWLHPQTPYTFEVDISEPNGGSDFSTVVVELASNQGSDSLSKSYGTS